ncbi:MULTISPECIES: serine hydrolase domain-containing protein [Halocynthiibacter]|uniref:Beta-lactamase family protein n=1 Tax=Halocynthiibacter halioticoli TaxID=2986804 RepID=A0AAE3LP33_9RHOB|nr:MULTISPECIES: serine hydrolase [Halocynthiibacter]MCV6822927.1 beta-lactamase family protein [Halocynthiibacter halioticoli]MCW4055928.1 beta-lactamase family protein [Halocynthiibacter sp. SDUM655004]
MSKLAVEETYRVRAQVSVPKLLECGDVGHWWCTHISETMPTALVHSPEDRAQLGSSPLPELFDISATTDLGTMSLSDYLVHPQSGARAFLAIKNGEVIAESYPDLRPEQPHLWASCAKPMAGLMIDHLIEQGRIDETRCIGDYVPALRDTDWHDVTVRDAMDMTPGMDCEENNATRADPSSNAIRAFMAEFNAPFQGRVESLLEVLQSSKRVSTPGEKFEYGSPCTQVLVLLAEAVSDKPWAELFRENVWQHVGAEGPMQVHLSPDGVALAHGVISSTLGDMARFGMLFTPSWPKVSTKQIVSEATLARIRNGVRDKAFFMNGYDGPVFTDRLADDTILGNARQWDCIWSDGDMYKGGFMDQGLYVSPSRDLVIVYFSTTSNMQMARYLRPIATSHLFA